MSRRNNRKKYINRNKPSDAEKKRRGTKVLLIVSIFVLLLVAAVVLLLFKDKLKSDDVLSVFDSKAELLYNEVIKDDVEDIGLSSSPARVVFISLCDSTDRARVFTGKGSNTNEAWNDACAKAREFVLNNDYNALWLKADLVNKAEEYNTWDFSLELKHWRHEFFRKGISFDPEFSTALLEAELNGAKILDYDEECVKLNYLNSYLKKAERNTLTALPDDFILFTCDGWFCDENGKVYELNNDGYEYGRRSVDTIDKAFAAELVENASGFLIDQVGKDGKFIYGYYPRFDKEIDNYNIVRHASTLWSLVCQYRMTGNEKLIPVIESAIDYMIDNAIVYSDDNTAYLYEDKSDEIKLGGCGVAVVALAEYMDALDSDKYMDVAVKLGNGILTMLDEGSGKYYHVLRGDFSRKEEFRTVYYDGEASFALCKLYGLTDDEKWLSAAESAAAHFIEADYTQYKDHWVAYTMNELTKYIDKPEYYEFALKNAQVNLDIIYPRDTTYHTYLELLMATFEVYDRMVERGIEVEYANSEFSLPYFLKTVYARADRLLNGYFFPEYAMYMKNPACILNTFMVRHDGYRVRIDDVQHSVGGYYLYYLNYDKLVDYGMLDYRD